MAAAPQTAARWGTKIKIVTGNINGVGTHEWELSHPIRKTKPEIVILGETKADAKAVGK